MAHNHTEHVQEEIHHHAAHGDHAGAKWITAAALTAAILAAFAAVSAALATKHLTESTLNRIAANDNWNFYQSKSIKKSEIDTRDMQYAMADASKQALAAKQHDDDDKKKKEYATPLEKDDLEKPQGMAGIQAKADRLEKISKEHLETHETYEMSATMFHIAIAVVAIAVVAKRKEFWWMSMVGGAIGLYFFASAMAHAPAHEGAHHEGTEQHAPATPGAAGHETSAAHETTPAATPAHTDAEHAPATGETHH